MIKLNHNKYRIYENLWGTTKTVSRGKIIALNDNIQKEESSELTNVILP